MAFKLGEGNIDCSGNGLFFKVGRRTNIDDQHRAPAIELLLKFVGRFRLGPDGPFRLRIHWYLRCSWAKENMPSNKMAVMVKPATSDFMSPPWIIG
jgi:hypothetical protein